ARQLGRADLQLLWQGNLGTGSFCRDRITDTRRNRMTTAYWCVLAALILPYCFTLTSKFTGSMPIKANAGVRDWQDKLADGVARRAHWAQLSSFEVPPAFAAAVIIAHQIGTAAQGTLDQLAIAFVISRVVY